MSLRLLPEDDGRFGGGVDVRGGQAAVGHDALGRGAAEDPHKGQLAGTARNCLCVSLDKKSRCQNKGNNTSKYFRRISAMISIAGYVNL